MQLGSPLKAALQSGDVGDGELLPCLDVVLGLESKGLVGEHRVGAVWDTGVRHEAECGKDCLAATIAACKRIGPEKTHCSVEIFILVCQGRVTGLEECVDILLVSVPQLLVFDPVLIVIHKVAQPLPHLWHLLLDPEQSIRSDGSVIVVRLREVGELNLVRTVLENVALNTVNPTLGTLLTAHGPGAGGAHVAPIHRLEAVEAAGRAAHPRAQGGGIVPHDQLESLNVPDSHHKPAHPGPLLHHEGETEVLRPVHLLTSL